MTKAKPDGETLDLRNRLKHLYRPSARAVSIVDVPELPFLMVDGQGDPNTAPAYREAIEALYAVAYTLKFAVKRAQGIDYPVMPLEGLWWTEPGGMPDFADRSGWRWTAMILQPELVTEEMVGAVIVETVKKKALPALPLLRLGRFHEGTAAQILYTGPYAGERPTIERLHAFIREQGHTLSGRHHEIYLSDPRRTAPDKLKTVIRQPFV